MRTKIIQEATEHLTLPTTIHEENEQWILTPDEEALAIHHAIKQYALIAKGMTLDDKILRARNYYTEDKIRQLLLTCNSNKHQQLWHEKQAKKRRDDAKLRMIELVSKCDANYFYNLIKENAGKPILENSIEYIKALCYFFSNDKRFETEFKSDGTFNLNKGLWIRGKTGVGKTFPLQCLQNNELQPFKIHSMLTIATEVSEDGTYEILEPLKVIDDVGSEQSIVNHYGTKINWFKDFIELYYAQQKPFCNLIITTNFDFKQVETNYGFRVRSRIKDMFNIIDVKGEDLRGK